MAILKRKNSYIAVILAVCFATFLCLPSSIHAQECSITKEAINNLFSPRLGTYSLWDLINGVPDMRQSFTDFIMENEAEVILAGYQQNNKMKRPIISKMNRRGRVLWTWMDKNQLGLSRSIIIKELIDEGQTFLAIGQFYRNNKEDGIWLARFDKSGKKQQENILNKKGVRTVYGGLTKAINNKDWLLSVTEVSSNTASSHARFVFLNNNFQQKFSRAFMPGPENKILSVKKINHSVLGDFYLAAGEIKDGYNRTSGLVLRLDQDSNIIWQRSYPRGDGLRFNDITISSDGYIIAGGEAKPINEEKNLAGLVMKLSPDNGAEIWQRYFMLNDMSYSGIDIESPKDGRSYILLKGDKVQGEDFQNHARIMTLSPRGETMNEISYTTGQNAEPEELKIGKDGSLLISGSATVNVPDPSDPENKVKITDQGWFLVGEKIGAYNDHCLIKEQPF